MGKAKIRNHLEREQINKEEHRWVESSRRCDASGEEESLGTGRSKCSLFQEN